MLERVEKTLKPVGMSSGTCGGASLQQQGVAHVAHSHRPWIRRQGQLVTGAAVAVDVSAISAVVLRMQNIQRDNIYVTADINRSGSQMKCNGGGRNVPFCVRWRTPSGIVCTEWLHHLSAKRGPEKSNGFSFQVLQRQQLK